MSQQDEPRWRFLQRRLITRADGRPYLDRFYIFRCPWFGIYLHRFLASDDDCLHDHPFAFVSVILRGGYWETTGEGWYERLGGPAWRQMPRRRHKAGSILFRGANHAHRIEIDPKRPAVTLVITGPKRRPWGFFTRFGWIPWREYSHQEHCS